MRKCFLINEGWNFVQHAKTFEDVQRQTGEAIDLPHTWNAQDGQDGGNDYYRGKCWYTKNLTLDTISSEEEVWLEFRGVAMVGEVYINGHQVASHKGGYSTFRANVTQYLEKENQVIVSADNRYRKDVYPQKADFTFYGGIYRDVYLIKVPKSHFSLDYFGSEGLKVTTAVQGDQAVVDWEVWATNTTNESKVVFEIEGEEKQEATFEEGYASGRYLLENVHLWDGLDDPYLYTASATLTESGDQVKSRFGCRTVEIDPEKGFFLNGRAYPLNGVSRHQDRLGQGNVLTKDFHREDIELITELGANTIRLAHYQHDQYFYDLCDKYGMIIWAEIPYITEHMEEGNENAYTQMKELVVQNYHHPSIVCWGLSNEITASSGVTDEIVKQHHRLNDLCHRLDTTRKTAIAHAFMLDPNNDFTFLADICSYNLYYGWYLGELEMNDKWFDDLHKAYPDKIIGFSEYGADANPQYQSPEPEKGDWTESYQAVFHEHILKMREDRPFIWAIHCWNMFDFGADGRNEGGKPGQNQKGLVTFDRKLKKDAFFIYQAYFSNEPFVHLCGRRYKDRLEEQTEIKVYSNQSEVTLYVDGEAYETQSGNKVFKFTVPISAEHQIKVVSENVTDEMVIQKVKAGNNDYVLEGREIINWFDRPDELEKEGCYSVLDKVHKVKENEEAYAIYLEYMAKIRESYGDVAKNIKMPEFIMNIQNEVSVMNQLKQSKIVDMEMMKEVNYRLNQIPKK